MGDHRLQPARADHHARLYLTDPITRVLERLLNTCVYPASDSSVLQHGDWNNPLRVRGINISQNPVWVLGAIANPIGHKNQPVIALKLSSSATETTHKARVSLNVLRIEVINSDKRYCGHLVIR